MFEPAFVCLIKPSLNSESRQKLSRRSLAPAIRVISFWEAISLAHGSFAMQDATSKECGLHSGNVVTSAAMQGAEELQKDLWPSGPVQALDHSQLEKLANGERDKDTLVVLYAPWCQYSQVCNLNLGGLLNADCLCPVHPQNQGTDTSAEADRSSKAHLKSRTMDFRCLDLNQQD